MCAFLTCHISTISCLVLMFSICLLSNFVEASQPARASLREGVGSGDECSSLARSQASGLYLLRQVKV